MIWQRHVVYTMSRTRRSLEMSTSDTVCTDVFQIPVSPNWHCWLWLTEFLLIYAGSSKALEPFVDYLSAMARALEAQQNKRIASNVLLAKQLSQMLSVVGSIARSRELLAAFPA